MNTCLDHVLSARQQEACSYSAMPPRRLFLPWLACAITLPLTVVGGARAVDAEALGIGAPPSSVWVEAALQHSAQVRFDECAVPGRAFGGAEKDLGNSDNSRASEPTGNRVEFQVIAVPHIVF
ncbi:hypothetical protein [Metapseudomonas furukawaii]